MPIQSKAELFEPGLGQLAIWAGALAHPARLMILQVLARRQSCICGQIVDELPLSQASVSRHLKALKEAGLIKGTIEGPRTCYCIDDVAFRAFKQEMTTFLMSLPDVPENLSCL